MFKWALLNGLIRQYQPYRAEKQTISKPGRSKFENLIELAVQLNNEVVTDYIFFSLWFHVFWSALMLFVYNIHNGVTYHVVPSIDIAVHESNNCKLGLEWILNIDESFRKGQIKNCFQNRCAYSVIY